MCHEQCVSPQPGVHLFVRPQLCRVSAGSGHATTGVRCVFPFTRGQTPNPFKCFMCQLADYRIIL